MWQFHKKKGRRARAQRLMFYCVKSSFYTLQNKIIILSKIDDKPSKIKHNSTQNYRLTSRFLSSLSHNWVDIVNVLRFTGQTH